jgi:hypothetical protein
MGLETGIALSAAYSLADKLKPLDPDIEVDFALGLASILNSPGYDHRKQPANAAVAYALAREGQRTLWQKFQAEQEQQRKG